MQLIYFAPYRQLTKKCISNSWSIPGNCLKSFTASPPLIETEVGLYSLELCNQIVYSSPKFTRKFESAAVLAIFELWDQYPRATPDKLAV